MTNEHLELEREVLHCRCLNALFCGHCMDRAYDWGLADGITQGAAVAFGLMGMAEAIRISHGVWERKRWDGDGETLRRVLGRVVPTDPLLIEERRAALAAK